MILLISVFVLIVVISVVFVFSFLSAEEDTSLLLDSEYDVFLSLGNQSPGMIDLKSGMVDVVDDQLVVEFSVREPVVKLGAGGLALYDVLFCLCV